MQCSSSYTLKDVGVHVEDVGVQCSILPWPIMYAVVKISYSLALMLPFAVVVVRE